MKHLQAFLVALLLSTSLFAQVPDALNYQAVARNSAGVALASQAIQIRLTVLKGLNSVYSETRSVTTNALGLFNVQIGSSGATATTGNFAAINWLSNVPAHTLKVELDITNSNLFTDMGTQPFSTVPFAYAANKALDAVNIGGRYVDPNTAPTVGSKLMWNGTAWSPVRDTIIVFNAGSGNSYAPVGFNGVWSFASNPVNLPVVTVNGNEVITASLVTGLFCSVTSPVRIPYNMHICYQSTGGGAIIPMTVSGTYNSYYQEMGTTSNVSSSAAFKLPAGTYRIGLGIRNTSSNAAALLYSADYISGFIQVKQ